MNTLTELKTIKDDSIIIEMKYPKNNESLELMNRSFLPFQRTRFSKYVTGLEKTLLI